MQDSFEEGATQEQLFTQISIDMLADVGETENTFVAYYEKDLGTRNQNKINAYAISDNYETIDLFIAIYIAGDLLQRIPKEKIDQAAKRVTNFFRKSIYGDFVNELEESSPIFEFVNTLANYSKIKENLVRVNATIITNGQYNGEIPEAVTINGYKIYYRVIDVNYLYNISESARVPIKISFEKEGYKVPCLVSTIENNDYETYVAIIPGMALASMYERFGSRLLEQNVRAFLQFSGKINKGIRTTIIEEPQMFLAFNNGISATADKIELDNTNHYIKEISNFQIVNGGQTTASIYHTWKKDNADISNIYVSTKLSVIKRIDDYAEMVSRISRYTNTQNKVNNADFTANNPFLIKFEKFSRYILTPITEHNNIQTNWFFERARGQYRNIRQRDGFTKFRKKEFDLKSPKNQVITKVLLAKYINSYQEVYIKSKLFIGPNIVVRGNEKNYALFITSNLPDINKINSVYFEDTIAKAILYKSCEKLYGVKPHSIGEIRSTVVPYTIAIFGLLTNLRLNLYKIWKNQELSKKLNIFMFELMKKVNAFIIKNSPGSLCVEWAKKEDCWKSVKAYQWNMNFRDIKNDLLTDEQIVEKRELEEINEDDKEKEYQNNILKSIPPKLWREIEKWGKQSGCLTLIQTSVAFDMANIVRRNKTIKDNIRKKAMAVYEIVCDKNIELLNKAEEIEEQLLDTNTVKLNNIIMFPEKITMEIVKQMVEWDKHEKVLADWKFNTMKKIIDGYYPLNGKYIYGCKMNLKELMKNGFKINSKNIG
ncbi:MAG: AIPR family protein [Bacteroidales bacterium]